MHMTKEKVEIMERMTKKFADIETPERKDFAMMCMTAYEAGREAGKKEKAPQEIA